MKARDPATLCAWYWAVLAQGRTRTYAVWSTFAADTKHFEPRRDFMINLRIDDLDGLLAQVKARGGEVLPRREETEDGQFGYVLDPEGVLLELWQPPAALAARAAQRCARAPTEMMNRSN